MCICFLLQGRKENESCKCSLKTRLCFCFGQEEVRLKPFVNHTWPSDQTILSDGAGHLQAQEPRGHARRSQLNIGFQFNVSHVSGLDSVAILLSSQKPEGTLYMPCKPEFPAVGHAFEPPFLGNVFLNQISSKTGNGVMVIAGQLLSMIDGVKLAGTNYHVCLCSFGI